MDVVSACLAVLGKRSLDTLLTSSNGVTNFVSEKSIEETISNAKKQAKKSKTYEINRPIQQVNDNVSAITLSQMVNLNGVALRTGNQGVTEWGQKEWMNFVQDLLLFLHHNDGKDHQNIFLEEFQQLPPDFGSTSGIYCFPVKGLVIPTGNLDGKIWKPSQGARETGNCMIKRYYYHKDQNENHIKRQVSWIRDFSDYTFFDYRCNFKGKVKLNQLTGPVNWPLLIQLVNEFSEKRKKEMPEVTPRVIANPVPLEKLQFLPPMPIVQNKQAIVPVPNSYPYNTPVKYDPFMDPILEADYPPSLQWNWEGLLQPIAAYGSQ